MAQNAGPEAYLLQLRKEDSMRKAAVSTYLKKHPRARRQYSDKRGHIRYIHHIDSAGRPVYYNTRRRVSR